MFDRAFHWTFVVETATPLHVGSGENASAESDGGETALVQRDGSGRPFLPGSSLKGIMRRRLEAAGGSGKSDAETVFGQIKAADQGLPGLLTVYDAPMCETPAPASYAKAPRADASKVSFIAARTAVSAVSGTAEDHMLFQQEMVPPGARFRVRLAMRLTPGSDEMFADMAASLIETLKQEGFALGKGQAGGHGRMEIAGDIACEAFTLGPEGWQSGDPDLPDPESLGRAGGEPVDLVLTCDGPFLIRDSSASKGKTRQKDERSQGDDQVVAQRLKDDLPLVLGSSIKGALRARLRWIAACDALAGSEGEAGERETAARDAGQKAAERLFGSPDVAARLRIERVDVSPGARPKRLTSVALDRHSSGPISGALFSSDTFLGTRIGIRLRLMSWPSDSEADRRGDKALFDALVEDVCALGLELGGGVAKGFGWFDCTREDSE